MKKLITLVACTAIALCSFAQKASTQDFAARFMKDNAGDENITCITVGPKMLSTLLKLDNDADDRKDAKVRMEGIKSIRIITSKKAAEELHEKAINLLKKNKQRYSLYTRKDKAEYGDCLWVRKMEKQIVELVYIAPEAEEMFTAMDFTGKISEGFIEKVVSLGKSEDRKQQ